mgnify:CR=1 FL=1
MNKKQSSLSEKSEFMNTKIDSKNSLKAKNKKWSLKKKLFISLLLIVAFISSGFLYEYKQKRSHFFIPTNGIYSEYNTYDFWFFTTRTDERIETTYKDGKKDGLEKVFKEDGSREEIYWSNGLKNGSFKSFNYSGRLIFKYIYENDIEKELVWWDDSGVIRNKLIWSEDNISQSKSYSSSGVQLAELNFLNDKLHGIQSIWNFQGIKIYEGEYKDGLRNGIVTSWNSDGILTATGKYNNDQINGSFQIGIPVNKRNENYFRNINVFEKGNSYVINLNNTKSIMISKKSLGSGSSTFDIAKASAEDCEFEGHTNWRLASENELILFRLISLNNHLKIKKIDRDSYDSAGLGLTLDPDLLFVYLIDSENRSKYETWYSKSSNVLKSREYTFDNYCDNCWNDSENDWGKRIYKWANYDYRNFFDGFEISKAWITRPGFSGTEPKLQKSRFQQTIPVRDN